ncbi:transcriptional regulator [Nakamurella panacisegetis]|uniref:Transcriptional regulator n=1 Tax=Nakamurella panacisegetis TaxID=1090615 RepID=A0A1H0RSI4_9ACTN|nr:YafY family protein [Nakamurella panacisegetis]SDP32482.1 transcriptional regulator [Nakamurella panacisegetis]
MATAKAERLLNLVIALVNSPRFRTANWIRDKVAGYSDAPTEEAFFRTFERDKTELRDLGIPLQTPDDGSDGYRILPGEFSLPQLSFTPAETAALGLAARLWETTALAGPGSNAIRKIRDAAPGDQDDDHQSSAAGLLQPRVRTGDPSFAPLYAAVRAGRAVTFDYRKDPAGAPVGRNVQPWGLVSYKGRWYLVGFDTDRKARRTFRLSRIAGSVKAVGRAGVASAPAGLDLLSLVAGSVELPAGRTTTLVIKPGSAAGLRRRATTTADATPSIDLDPAGRHAGWDVVQMPFAHLWDTARTIAGQGPDVLVVEPPDLREAVIRLLVGAAGSAPGMDPEAMPRFEPEDVRLDVPEVAS